MEDLNDIIKKAHDFLRFRNVFCILPHMDERSIQIYLKMDNPRRIRHIKKIGKKSNTKILYQNLKTFDWYCAHMRSQNHVQRGLCMDNPESRIASAARSIIEHSLIKPEINSYPQVRFYDFLRERQEFELITTMDFVITYKDRAALFVIQDKDDAERPKQKGDLNRFVCFTQRVYGIISFPFRVVSDSKEKSFELLDSKDNLCYMVDIKDRLGLK